MWFVMRFFEILIEEKRLFIWLKIKKGQVIKITQPFCDPTGARTQDPIIKSDVLYQLSYRVIIPFLNGGAKIVSFFW